MWPWSRARAQDVPREVEHARRDDLGPAVAREGALGLDPDPRGGDLGDPVRLGELPRV